MNIRVGFGFDVHPLIDGRKFYLGGILINHHKGADGHSDADVLIHAICDALLGAAALGDIGKHFPNTDDQFKNIDSKKLLTQVISLLQSEGWKTGNIDATLVLEKPKILAHVPEMKKVLAGVMNINENQISIKATTNEKLGYVGREEGVCAYAVCLIQRI